MPSSSRSPTKSHSIFILQKTPPSQCIGPSNYLLCLLDQLLNPETLIPLTKLLQQPLPLPKLPPIKFLQAHNQPPALLNTNASPFNHIPLQQHNALVLRQIQMMRNRRMRLTKLSSQFIFRQVREQHRRSRGCGKRPLQEVDFCASVLSRKGEDELGVPPCSGFDVGVYCGGDGRAQGLRTIGMAEPPDVFDFFCGEGEGFGNVDVGGERLDARGCGELRVW